jgi:hypothetical protein
MLDRRQPPLWSDRSQSAVNGAVPELGRPAARETAAATGGLERLVYGVRAKLVQPRALIGLALIAGGVVWAIARGLHFYGLTPAEMGYDLDQPPLLLVWVAAWLLYRSRRR